MNSAAPIHRLAPWARRWLLTAVVASSLATVAGCANLGPAHVPPSPIPRQAGCVDADRTDALCIVILGDSLAVGAPLSYGDQWWPKLRRQLEAALPQHAIAIDNWAVSGSQIDVLESVANDQPAVATFDVAIVIEGVNDAHLLPIREWLPRYEAAISTLEAKGVTVIVTAPPPSIENGAFSTRFDPVAVAVRDVASRGRPLLDLAGRWHADGLARAGLYYTDWIHQSATGQDLMADMAREVILDAIDLDVAAESPPRQASLLDIAVRSHRDGHARTAASHVDQIRQTIAGERPSTR